MQQKAGKQEHWAQRDGYRGTVVQRSRGTVGTEEQRNSRYRGTVVQRNSGYRGTEEQ